MRTSYAGCFLDDPMAGQLDIEWVDYDPESANYCRNNDSDSAEGLDKLF
jgi:hypothetical protein